MTEQIVSTKKIHAREKIKSQKQLVLMVLPAVIAYFLFAYLPLLGWSLAFFRYQPGIKLSKSEFVGLNNFKYFFTQTSDANILFRNTICISIFSLIAIFLFSIIFSIMLNEVINRLFSRTVQMVSLFPFFLSWVIGYALVYAMFSLESGAINAILMKLGIIKEGINVLGSAKAAWPLMVGLNVWKNLGYYSIIFISTIVSIPVEQFESASIDGASRFQKILHITLPNLKQVFFVMLILQSGTIFSSNLEQFFAFTNSQNWEMMAVFDMYIYKHGLAQGDYSYATAVGIIKTVVSIVLLFTVNKLSKKFADQSVF